MTIGGESSFILSQNCPTNSSIDQEINQLMQVTKISSTHDKSVKNQTAKTAGATSLVIPPLDLSKLKL
jgi:hypothetical protein